MDFLIELLFDLILEGSVEAAKSKKVPRWIRYPLICLLALLVVGMIGGVAALAIFLLVKRQGEYALPLGIVLLILDMVMLASAVRKVRKQLRDRHTFADRASATDAEKGENADDNL